MRAATGRPCVTVRCTARTVRVVASSSVPKTVKTAPKIPVKDVAGFSVQGTSRKVNEDRFDYKVVDEVPEFGDVSAFLGIYDGHGGYAVSEWLEEKFPGYVGDLWEQFPPESAVTKAFLEADKKLLQPKGGFFGAMGERGVGGSKCGATGAIALTFQDKEGAMKLLCANAGDSRVILIRNGKAVQLTEDHVPDAEEERIRIERQNPNPKMPLVRFVGDTWRVGGILALSRAFGDAYMKGSLQFEGIPAGSDNYSSGFGVIAEPYISVTDLTEGDSWVIIHTDGLNDTSSRGGGGGLTNQEIADMCIKAGATAADQLAESLALSAQQAGSTDDVSVICLKLDL